MMDRKLGQENNNGFFIKLSQSISTCPTILNLLFIDYTYIEGRDGILLLSISLAPRPCAYAQ